MLSWLSSITLRSPPTVWSEDRVGLQARVAQTGTPITDQKEQVLMIA